MDVKGIHWWMIYGWQLDKGANWWMVYVWQRDKLMNLWIINGGCMGMN